MCVFCIAMVCRTFVMSDVCRTCVGRVSDVCRTCVGRASDVGFVAVVSSGVEIWGVRMCLIFVCLRFRMWICVCGFRLVWVDKCGVIICSLSRHSCFFSLGSGHSFCSCGGFWSVACLAIAVCELCMCHSELLSCNSEFGWLLDQFMWVVFGSLYFCTFIVSRVFFYLFVFAFVLWRGIFVEWLFFVTGTLSCYPIARATWWLFWCFEHGFSEWFVACVFFALRWYVGRLSCRTCVGRALDSGVRCALIGEKDE